MNVLFDPNVVLDALLDQIPWADAAVALFGRVESGDTVGHLGATTVTTVHYIASRNVGATAAGEMMQEPLRLFEVAPVNRTVLENALNPGFADSESAVLHETGRPVGAGALTARDPSASSKPPCASTRRLRWSPPRIQESKVCGARP